MSNMQHEASYYVALRIGFARWTTERFADAASVASSKRFNAKRSVFAGCARSDER